MIEATELRSRLEEHQRYEDAAWSEETGTLLVNGRRLFFHLVRPAGEVRSAGLVICHSYFELTMLQEAEIALAREAAVAGFASIYVQAPGMGDSEGDPKKCFVKDRVAAVEAAFAELRTRVNEVSRPCFFGARVGGLVAALAAQRADEAALAMWDPSFNAPLYWKQVRRLARITAVVGRQHEFKDPQQDLARQGLASVLHVDVTPQLLDDLGRTELSTRNGVVAGPTFLLALNATAAKAALGALSGIVAASPHVHSVGHRDIWHLGLRRGKGATAPTVAWMTEVLA
jgi:hypothetical protein